MKNNKLKNKYIIGIESSSIVSSVCIYENDSLLDEINVFDGMTHASTLFVSLKKLLDKNNVDIALIDYIAVSNGPGSYTGLRIGIACALGLAKPYKLKVLFVDSLKTLAYNIKTFDKQFKSINFDNVFTMNDAKANRIYLSIFNKNLNVNFIETIVDIDEFIKLYNKYFVNEKIKNLFLGDATCVYKDKFKQILYDNVVFVDEKLNYPYAKSSISAVLCDYYNITKNKDINYMQKSQAERQKEMYENNKFER